MAKHSSYSSSTSSLMMKSTSESAFVLKKRSVMNAKLWVAWLSMKPKKRRVMNAKLYAKLWRDALRNKCYPGIESSHGRTWIRGTLLGEGTYGSVFLATPRIKENGTDDKHPEMIAVKSAEFTNSKSLKDEKKVLCCLKHSPYIIQCYGAEITKSEDGEKTYYNLLLEYASGGSLSQQIENTGGLGLPEDEVRRYTSDILRGICYTHCHGYAHCDIKPDNILLVHDPKDGCLQAKLGDFGSTKKANHFFIDEEDYRFEMLGTFRYMSPEIMIDHITEQAADIWALGCTIIEMLTGKVVWGFENDMHNNPKAIKDLFGRVSFSPELPEMPSSISEECRDFLMKCFERDPSDRWAANELIQHPFIV